MSEQVVETLIQWLDPAAKPPFVCPACLMWWSEELPRPWAVHSLRSHLLTCSASPEQVADNFVNLLRHGPVGPSI